MSKPAFLIDGFMEKIILQRLGIKSPIRRIDLNGKDVQIFAIAKKISTLINMMGGKYFPIIILIDREDRKILSKDIICKLKDELIKLEIHDELIIGVANRNIENWILADWDNFKKNASIKKQRKHRSFEGLNGKTIIRKYLPTYQETTDGVNLFIASHSSTIKRNSESFKSFVDPIKEVCCCQWLNNIDEKTL